MSTEIAFNYFSGSGVSENRTLSFAIGSKADDDSLLFWQLRSFLSSQIDEWKPDFIIGHERKGTAILRALLEAPTQPLTWPWTKVISSSALDQINPDLIRGKRLLIFDDLLQTGNALRRVFQRLNDVGNLSSELVRLAVFAAHEDASCNGYLKRTDISVDWFCRDLSRQSYERLREQILRLLQRSGSLMLDTEHIEVRLRLHSGMTTLLTALRKRADVVVFQSAANRTNITVYYPDDPGHHLPTADFPVRTVQIGIVKKCRIVEREPDQFAIIPICLPSIECEDCDWPVRKEDKALLGDAVVGCAPAKFYGAALLASLHPLKWILRDLHTSDESLFTISLPSVSARAGSDGFDLEHLHAMYPTIRLDLLVERIAQTDLAARSESARLRNRRSEMSSCDLVPDIRIQMDSMSLLQVIAKYVDVMHVKDLMFSEPVEHHRSGLKTSQIFELGNKLGFRPAYISALFDLLIDSGRLVTRVEEICGRDGIRRLERTFKPDGEVVSQAVREFSAQWGLPHGF